MTEKERFPGERERDTLVARQPGAGSPGTGADLPAADDDPSVGAETARDRAREGGGDEGQRRHRES